MPDSAPARRSDAPPADYRSWGVLPGELFIDGMMRALGREYYVSLLTAAAMHGAAHQAPQVFQVMVDRHVADRDLDALTTHIPAGYNPDIAADLVMRELGSRLRNAPPAEEIGPLHQ